MYHCRLLQQYRNICPKLTSVEPGRPAFDISAELLEDLLGLGFSRTKIAKMLEVSRGTIPTRIKAYSLDDFTRMTFSKLTNDELDQKVGGYKTFIYELDVSYAPTYIFRSNGYLNCT